LTDYTTTKTSSILPELNLPRCLLDQSRFTVLPSPAAASNNSDLERLSTPPSRIYAQIINGGIKGRVMRYRHRHAIEWRDGGTGGRRRANCIATAFRVAVNSYQRQRRAEWPYDVTL